MKQAIVMSVLGKDTPGLVKALSKLIVSHEGEWVESRMAQLGGKFAGILRIHLPVEQIDAFENAIHSTDLGLNVQFERADSVELKSENVRYYQLELIGQDQPGIVHRLATALESLGGNVEDLHSEVVDASMSGEHLFKAEVELSVADSIAFDDLKSRLNEMADDLVLDIDIEPMVNA